VVDEVDDALIGPSTRSVWETRWWRAADAAAIPVELVGRVAAPAVFADISAALAIPLPDLPSIFDGAIPPGGRSSTSIAAALPPALDGVEHLLQTGVENLLEVAVGNLVAQRRFDPRGTLSTGSSGGTLFTGKRRNKSTGAGRGMSEATSSLT